MRVDDHPILGPRGGESAFEITVDGRAVPAREGDTIASALVASGVRVFRTSTKRHEPRGMFCAIGRCTDCAMTVDGTPNVRTCITPARPGMVVETQHGLGEWRAGETDSEQDTCPEKN